MDVTQQKFTWPDFGGRPLYTPIYPPSLYAPGGQTDKQTQVNSWARPRGAQLTAGYTVNTYSIIHSALARLAWRAYARGLYSRRCRTTYHRPDTPTASRPFCQYPAVSWEIGDTFTRQSAVARPRCSMQPQQLA